MAVLATDNFNRANNVDLGASWDVITGEGGSFQIINNAAEPIGNGTKTAESNNTVTWPNDQYSQAVLPIVTTTEIGTGCGVLVRAAVGARTYYRCLATTTGAEIAKYVAGTFTQIATNGTAWANGDTVYLSAIGTTLQVKRNGTNLFSATDSDIASGRAGINHSWQSSAGTNLDNWEGGDFSGGGGGGIAGRQALLGVGR